MYIKMQYKNDNKVVEHCDGDTNIVSIRHWHELRISDFVIRINNKPAMMLGPKKPSYVLAK